MFNKKKCQRCKEKINKEYDFCPYCGYPLKENEKDFGMLGKRDNIENEFGQFSNSFFRGGFGGSMINKMLGNAIKVLEKEMQKEMKNNEVKPKTNFQLFINGKKINLNNMERVPEKKEKIKKIQPNSFSKEQIKKFSTLPRKEPSAKVRRLSDKIVYEIDMPEVKSKKDISIAQLENSIEIKAIAKDKSYFKMININLPIINYDFSDEKLVLELNAKN